MGQEAIEKVLAQRPQNWLTVKDISEATKVGIPSTTVALKRMRKFNEVKWDTARTTGGLKYYIYTHNGKVHK